MLVYSNGAFKSGSTWLYSIARQIRRGGTLPEQYQNPNQNAVGIIHEKLEEFLKKEDYATKDYVVKAHLASAKGREMLENQPNVKILTIERDIRDVTVSSYYHYVRIGKFKGSFEEYFPKNGEKTIRRVLRFHRLWAPTSPSIFKTTYEELLENFDGEVGKLARFLEVELTEPVMERIREHTSLENSQKRERSRKGEGAEIYFFRKGTSGQWTDYLTPTMLERIEQIRQEVATMPLQDEDES